jgi:hypothetical protein
LIVLDFNPRSIKEEGVFLDKVVVNVKKLNIVRNKDDVVNLEKVKALTPQEEPGIKAPFGADKVIIEVGDVHYIDYTKEEKNREKVIELNLKEEYRHLDDSFQISQLIACKVFFNGKMGNIGVNILKIQEDLAKLAERNKSLSEDFTLAMKETVAKTKKQVAEQVEEKIGDVREKIEEVKDKMEIVKETSTSAREKKQK